MPKVDAPISKVLSIKDKTTGEEVFQIDFQDTPLSYRQKRIEKFKSKYRNHRFIWLE